MRVDREVGFELLQKVLPLVSVRDLGLQELAGRVTHRDDTLHVMGNYGVSASSIA